MENNNQKQHDDIKNKVLEKIREGRVRMRPKFFFALKIIVLALVAAFILILTSFVLSFIFFSIAATGKMFLVGFGIRGLFIFFLTLPWLPLVIDILLIIVLERLLKRFKFGYRSPIVYLSVGIIAIAIFIAFIINMTQVHPLLVHRAQQNRLPLIGGMYKDARRPPMERCIYRGYIQGIATETPAIIIHPDDIDSSTTVRILLPSYANPERRFEVNDYVFVACQYFKSEIRAFGVKKIAPPR